MKSSSVTIQTLSRNTLPGWWLFCFVLFSLGLFCFSFLSVCLFVF